MINKAIRLELPWPPALNSLYRFGNGNYYISDAGKKYKQDVGVLWLAKRMAGFEAAHKLKMVMFMYPPDKRKRDIDGLFKITFDALQSAGVYKDDSQIKSLYAEMREKSDKAYIELVIEAIA